MGEELSVTEHNALRWILLCEKMKRVEAEGWSDSAQLREIRGYAIILGADLG